MGKHDNDKPQKKRAKAKLAVNRIENDSNPRNEQRASQNSGDNNFSFVIQPQEKKRNVWDYIKLGSEIAAILIFPLSVAGLIYAANSAKSAAQSVKDNLENFQKQNMPYLQIGGFKVNGDTLFFSLFNLNQYPAKIKTGKFAISTKADIKHINMFGGAMNPKEGGAGIIELRAPQVHLDGSFSWRPTADPAINNQYVIKESPVEAFYTGYSPSIYNLHPEIYLLGQIFYTDEVAETERMYQFIMRIYGTPQNIKTYFISNINPTIKEG